MSRWILGCLGIVIALCVSCIALFYFVAIPNMQTSTSEAVAESVWSSTSFAIALNGEIHDVIRIRESELVVNNYVVPGEAGIQWTTDGAQVYGVETRIRTDAIALFLDDVEVFAGKPIVEGGRIELIDIRGERGFWSIFLSKGLFANAIEEGLNRTLAQQGITPISIELQNGLMLIRVEASRPGGPTWVD